MELITTYPAAVNSKATVTMGVLDQATTIVEVLDATVLPEAPNLLVLGTDQTAETVLMTARENNTLTIQRAVQGIAKSWPAGTQIARNFTGKDWDDMRSNVEAIVTKILGLTASDVGALPNNQPVPIDKGGTGASDVLSARSNLRFYSSIESIGLSGTPTMDEIGNALPVHSRLVWSAPTSYTTGTGAENTPDKYGTLIVDKTGDISRTTFLFFKKNGGLYIGSLNNDNTFKQWLELADASKFLPLADGAGFHNSVYRGKSLGSAVTDAQWAAISNGTFRDLYIGDYWTIGGINYRIAAFDYYLRSGDNADLTTHHVTLVPDTNMYSAQMNSTDTTTGAYVGSEMYTANLAQAKTTINNAFGSAHILTHRRHMQNAVTNGYSTGGAWYDSTVELMTEQNVYGGRIFGNCINGTGWPNLYTTDKSQYPLFAMRPDMISNRQTYWLRDVASASDFCGVADNGLAGASRASNSRGIRPAFSIKS